MTRTTARYRRYLCPLAHLLVVLAVGTPTAPLFAAGEERERVLLGIELTEAAKTWRVQVNFAVPVRYLRHSPKSRGKVVEIQLEPLAQIPGATARRRETAKPPPKPATPLRDISFEAATARGPALVATFSRSAVFSVSQGRDFRSLIIRIAKPQFSGRGARRAVPGAGEVTAIMEEARRALVARNYGRAIALYTKVLSGPEGEHTREALEYLGLARQRNGQTAHAAAEFEAYLERYPDDEGADRVRQRLETLRTARDAPRKKLKTARRRSKTDLDLYGSIATTYQRTGTLASDSGAAFLDASQSGDLDFTALMRRGRLDARGRFDGYYRYDYLEGGTARGSRVRYLNLELRDRTHELTGTLGRQPGRGSGLLGRFDGLSLGWGFYDKLRLGGVLGFPQDSIGNNGVDTSRSFYGLNLSTDRVLDHLDAEVYFIGQVIDGHGDRVAFGSELRLFGAVGSLYTAVDYDVFYKSLNLAMASGSLNITKDTNATLRVDHRNSPFLRTSNALMGEPVVTIGDLHNTYSMAQIEQLAQDRTTRTTTITSGISHRLDARWEIAADMNASMSAGTPASGNSLATEGTGWAVGYGAELIGSDLLLDGDLGRARFGVNDGSSYRNYTLLLRARFPILDGLRITPTVRADYLDYPSSRDQIKLEPQLRLEYRWRDLTLDADTVLEWRKGVGSGPTSSSSDDLGYALYLGLRFDF